MQHSLSQLCAVMVKHETPDRWPALLQLLSEATKSGNAKDRQVHKRPFGLGFICLSFLIWLNATLASTQIGLLLLNKVMESNPEPFKPHYCQLLQLLSTVLQDHDNPKTLYYCILTLTAITAYIGSAELVSRGGGAGHEPVCTARVYILQPAQRHVLMHCPHCSCNRTRCAPSFPV